MPEQRTFAGSFSQAVEQACREREVDQRGLADAIARFQYRVRAHGPMRDELIRRSGRSWESRISAWKSGRRLPGSEADLRAALRVIAPGTLATDWLDLWQKARRQRREQPPGPGRGRPAAEPGPAEGHHWRASAGEESPGANTSFLFTGRGTAISAITAWLTDPGEPRVCVVTGDPGSGKSAVLSWFALQDAPDDRRRFHDRHDYPRMPEGAIAATVHARGRDLTDIIQDIARQVGVAARDVEGLARALAERRRKIVVLLDAADEAEDAERQLVPKLILPVVRGWAGQPLRLLLGARQHIARRLPASVASVNLDHPQFVDDADLHTYVTRVLGEPRNHAARWSADAKRVARVAAAVARHAARSYLVAQLVARAVVERGELPSPDQPFPHDVAEAMQYYLAALPLDQLEAEDLLRPLAFARGQGLPVHLWSALAGRLSGRPLDDAARAVAELFYGPLASLIEVSKRSGPEGAGPDLARYRLFHDALDDYVAGTPAAFPSAPPPGRARREALAAGLLAAVPLRADGARDWSAADPYIRRYIAAHAIGTSVLTQLIDDAPFLLCGDPDVIIPALRELSGHTAAIQAYQEFTSLSAPSGPAIPLPQRAAQLALAATKTASSELVRTWDAALRFFGAAASWWPVAARWRTVARHRVVRSHRDAVNQALALTVFGETVVVSAGEDGILGLTPLAETDLGADRSRELKPAMPSGLDFSRSLRALAVTSLDSLPLVVVGDEDGQVHVVDLPEATVSHSTQSVPGPAVTAICLTEADDPVVVVGRADGTMQARTLPALEPLGNPVPTDGTEVFAIVPVPGSEVVAATGSGLLWRWDPGGMAPSLCYDGAPRVTALGSAVLRPPARDLVTGHDDGVIKVWDRAGPTVIGQAELTPRYAVVVAGTILDGHPLVLCGAENDEIYVLDVADEKVWLTALTGHHDAVWDLTIIDLGERPGLLGAGEDGGVHLWLLDSLASIGSDNTFSDRHWSFGSLEESATGLIAFAVDYDGRFALLDALSGEPRGDSTVAPDSASVSSSAVRVVGQEIYCAVGTEAGQVGVGVWPGLIWLDSPHQDWVTAAHFVEMDGMLTLLTVSADGQVCFWDPDGARSDPRQEYCLSGLTDAVNTVSVAGSETDDPEMLVGCRDGWAGSWRMRDGSPVEPLRQRMAERIDSVARLGGATVAGGGAGQVVVSIPGARETTIRRHTRSVTRLIVTGGTGRAWLVTGGEDGIVTVAAEDRLDRPAVVLDVDAPVTDLLVLRNSSLAIATQYGVAVVDVAVAGWPGLSAAR